MRCMEWWPRHVGAVRRRDKALRRSRSARDHLSQARRMGGGRAGGDVIPSGFTLPANSPESRWYSIAAGAISGTSPILTAQPAQTAQEPSLPLHGICLTGSPLSGIAMPAQSLCVAMPGMEPMSPAAGMAKAGATPLKKTPQRHNQRGNPPSKETTEHEVNHTFWNPADQGSLVEMKNS